MVMALKTAYFSLHLKKKAKIKLLFLLWSKCLYLFLGIHCFYLPEQWTCPFVFLVFKFLYYYLGCCGVYHCSHEVHVLTERTAFLSWFSPFIFFVCSRNQTQVDRPASSGWVASTLTHSAIPLSHILSLSFNIM